MFGSYQPRAFFPRLAVGLLIWLLAAPALWAQPGQPAGAPVEKGYTVSYLLVILACALGLVLICRSSNRTTEVKVYKDSELGKH